MYIRRVLLRDADLVGRVVAEEDPPGPTTADGIAIALQTWYPASPLGCLDDKSKTGRGGMDTALNSASATTVDMHPTFHNPLALSSLYQAS